MLVRSVFLLRLHKTATDVDGVKFVLADAPEQDLRAPGLGIEIPISFSPDDRDRKRPIVSSDHKFGAAIRRIYM